MKVTITAIDFTTAVPVRGTSALGYPGKFGCPLGTGRAVFIPARGFERNLCVGQMIAVETSYEEIAKFEVLSRRERETLYELAISGNYLIVGEVINVAPMGMVSVSVRGLLFKLHREELNGSNPELGDCVRFELRGLSFWDCNI